MRRLPPDPQVGDRVTAELVRELIRCIRERQLLKGPNYSLQTGPNGTVLKLDPPKRQTFPREPLPFEVRWDATLNNGAGGYKIYLPTEHLLSYAGEDIATSDISGATPIPDANGDDTAWSVLDDIDTSADHVWLVVTISDESAADAEDGEDGEEGSSGGSIEAEFASEEGQSVTGSTVVNICIAEVSYEEPEDEGGTPTVEIKQSVVGALHLGGKSDSVTPDDVSTEFIPEPEEGEETTGDEGKLQIKGYKTATPVSSTTIAADLQATGANAGHVIFRESDGTLKYKSIGTMQGGQSVEPDDVSMEFIPEPEEGEEPTRDEGKLQIKGFKSGQPADTNTIAEYLMGTAQISGQVWLIVRGKSTDGDPVLGYLPLDALNLYEYAKKTDLPSAPGDGTLTIKQGTTTLGTFTANQATGTTVTIPEPPTPPTVNDGTLTIKQGETTLGTFTANQATGTTVTIPEPPTPPSGTVNFIADMRWNTTTHTLQKRVDSLNMATGAVTQGAWSDITNGGTTPISSILPQSS